MLKNFTVQGSVDGTNWVDLYTGRHQNSEDMAYYTLSNGEAYRDYRIKISSVWRRDGYVALVEVQLLQ